MIDKLSSFDSCWGIREPRAVGFLLGSLPERLIEDLVHDNRNRMRQIDDGVRRIRRNIHQNVGAFHLLVAQPSRLRSKQNGRVQAVRRVLYHRSSHFPRVCKPLRRRFLRVAEPRRRGDHEGRLAEGFVHAVDDFYGPEELVGLGGCEKLGGITEGVALRIHRVELADREVFHQPRDRANVYRTLRLDQNDSNMPVEVDGAGCSTSKIEVGPISR
mmetsp:Transcript_20971/g.51685  ORF Transcript_20971/g.51685 Transcript_20971/m.51685 type:complete len:215 (+) Transcript_20971:1755-2399(+)